MVTRAREQSESFCASLRALGADAIDLPTIEIRPAADYGPLDAAIAASNPTTGCIFTSANGVRFFMDRLDASSRDLRALRAKICVIGPATRAAVEALHLKVDVMAKEYVGEGLLRALSEYDLSGSRVLLPRAAVARDVVPAELSRRGACVEVVEAYRTVVPDNLAEEAREVLTRKPDWIVFTSSSTARNFVATAGVEALQGVKTVSIGPITSGTLRELGIGVSREAREHTTEGILAALSEQDV